MNICLSWRERQDRWVGKKIMTSGKETNDGCERKE